MAADELADFRGGKDAALIYPVDHHTLEGDRRFTMILHAPSAES